MFSRRTLRWALVVLLLATSAAAPMWARWADVNLLHEQLKDCWGDWYWHEDWRSLTPIPKGLDAGWLSASQDGSLRIAHALGESGEVGSDTLGAFQRSARHGFRVFEVDLYLDDEQRLRCYHGPEKPPPFDSAHDCTLDNLLPQVIASDGWLVLDIKSDFISVAGRVAALVRGVGHGERVIFQLYRPADVRWFSQVAKSLNLARPIITAYAAKRSVNHVAAQVARLGAAAFTMPAYKLSALNVDPGVPLLIHPVHDCGDWRPIDSHPVQGIYTLWRFDPMSCRR